MGLCALVVCVVCVCVPKSGNIWKRKGVNGERLASIGVDSGSMVQWFLSCVVSLRIYVEYSVSNLSYGLK